MLCCVLEVVGFSWLAVVLSLSPSRCLMVSFVHIKSFYIMKTCKNSCEGLRQNALLEVASLFINCEKSFLPVHGAICWFCPRSSTWPRAGKRCCVLCHLQRLGLARISGDEVLVIVALPPQEQKCVGLPLFPQEILCCLSRGSCLPPLLTRCGSSFPAGNIPMLQTKILGQLQPAAVASPVGAFA